MKNEEIIENPNMNKNEIEKSQFDSEKISSNETNENDCYTDVKDARKEMKIKEKDFEIKIDKDYNYEKIKKQLEKGKFILLIKYFIDEQTSPFAQKNDNLLSGDLRNNPLIEKHNDSYNQSDTNFIDLHKKTKNNKQLDLKQFFKKSRHFFIMSEGGQPIYTRYGDELQNCELLATFSAIITKFTHFQNTSNTKEKINYIKNEKSIVVFLKKGKIIFIALSKKNDNISLLNSQLEYLYLQLVSIITADRLNRLEDNPRNLLNALSDTNELFEQILSYTTHSLVSLLNSYQTLVMDSVAKNRLSTICAENRGDALLCIILTPYEIVTISKSDLIGNVSSNDIILIQNLIFSSESLKQTESWVPICLPGISDCGYLQMYTNFFEPNFGLVFITESQEHSYFLKFADQSREIYQTALDEKLVSIIKFAFNNKNKSNSGFSKNKNLDLLENEDKLIDEFFKKLSGRESGSSKSLPILPKRNSISTLNQLTNDPFEDAKYLICKNRITNQYFTLRFNTFNRIDHNEKHVLKCYSKLYDIYSSNNLPINSHNFFYFEKSPDMTHTIQSNEHYILFASYNLFEDYDAIHNFSTDILKIIKYNESHFFITKY